MSVWSAAYIITVVHPSYGLRLQTTSAIEPTESVLVDFIGRYPDVKHIQGSRIYVSQLKFSINVDDLELRGENNERS